MVRVALEGATGSAGRAESTSVTSHFLVVGSSFSLSSGPQA
jgi:hypothetical protein